MGVFCCAAAAERFVHTPLALPGGASTSARHERLPGARRSPAFIRRSLVEPSADVPLSTTGAQNFAFIRVKTKDGREASGVRMSEGTFYVQFRDITGALYSFPKSELASVESDRTSPMPAYSGLYTPAEMDDVIAYLTTLRGKKPGQPNR